MYVGTGVSDHTFPPKGVLQIAVADAKIVSASICNDCHDTPTRGLCGHGKHLE